MGAIKLGDIVNTAMQYGIDQFTLHEINHTVHAAGAADVKPYISGRPMATASAPSASAFTISVPRRIPLSIIMGTSPCRGLSNFRQYSNGRRCSVQGPPAMVRT